MWRGIQTFALRLERSCAATRIDDGMLRLSCGIEDPAALIADIEQALAVS